MFITSLFIILIVLICCRNGVSFKSKKPLFKGRDIQGRFTKIAKKSKIRSAVIRQTRIVPVNESSSKQSFIQLTSYKRVVSYV